MNTEKYKVLGVMSGTSLDGIDCAIVEFTNNNGVWNFNFISGKTTAYSKDWQNKLQTAIHLSDTDLHLLNIEYTYFFLQNDLIRY